MGEIKARIDQKMAAKVEEAKAYGQWKEKSMPNF